jgi:hypothetical protein
MDSVMKKKDLKTTLLYAKIVNESKRKAVDSIEFEMELLISKPKTILLRKEVKTKRVQRMDLYHTKANRIEHIPFQTLLPNVCFGLKKNVYLCKINNVEFST